MKIIEIIEQDQQIRLNEARIAHAEDLVFFEGSNGAKRALDSLLSLIKDKSPLSIKWDGSPCLIVGRDQNGTFILTDKAGFTAKGYDGLYKTPAAFVKQKRLKNVDETYLKKIVNIWPLLKAIIPTGFRGFVVGDVMWFPGDLKENNKRYVFTPNTVTYEVDKNSELGEKIRQSQAGFAIHTYVTEPGAAAQPLRGLDGLKITKELCILGPEIKNEAPVTIEKNKIKQASQVIKQNSKAIDSFLNVEVLSSKKIMGLPDMLYAFVNSRARDRDLSRLAEQFPSWIQANPKISKAMVTKLTDYIKENRTGLAAIFNVFDLIVTVKMDILHQLDLHDGPVIAHISGARGGEGYVAAHDNGPIKLVNRVGFSASNFEKNG
jgi:hypothetical protein